MSEPTPPQHPAGPAVPRTEPNRETTSDSPSGEEPRPAHIADPNGVDSAPEAAGVAFPDPAEKERHEESRSTDQHFAGEPLPPETLVAEGEDGEVALTATELSDVSSLTNAAPVAQESLPVESQPGSSQELQQGDEDRPPEGTADEGEPNQSRAAVKSGAGASGALPEQPAPSKPATRTRTVVNLLNGMVGRPYEARLQIDDLSDARLKDPAEIGLTYDPDTMTFAGNPTQHGTYVFPMQALVAGEPTDLEIQIYVNPDPSSLMENIPSDKEKTRLHKADSDSRGCTGELLMVGASQRGRSHAQRGDCRDDDFSLTYSESSGWHIMVVADGAGSAPFSREGSRIVTNYMATALSVELPRKLDPYLDQLVSAHLEGVATPPSISMRHREEVDDHMARVLEHLGEQPLTVEQEIRLRLYESLAYPASWAAGELKRAAKDYDLAVSDLSTTLIATVSRRMSNGRWFTAAYGVGDGGAGLVSLGPDGPQVNLLTQPESGEYAGQTRFLTEREVADHTRNLDRIFFHVTRDFTALLAMTDGVSDVWLETQNDFLDPAKWAELWADVSSSVDLASPEGPSQLLDWLNFWSPGNYDDRTLAIAVPRENTWPSSE